MRLEWGDWVLLRVNAVLGAIKVPHPVLPFPPQIALLVNIPLLVDLLHGLRKAVFAPLELLDHLNYILKLTLVFNKLKVDKTIKGAFLAQLLILLVAQQFVLQLL